MAVGHVGVFGFELDLEVPMDGGLVTGVFKNDRGVQDIVLGAVDIELGPVAYRAFHHDLEAILAESARPRTAVEDDLVPGVAVEADLALECDQVVGFPSWV